MQETRTLKAYFLKYADYLYVRAMSMLALKKAVFKAWNFQQDVQNS